MAKTATEVMQGVLFAAVMDAIVALKAASKGLPNALLRDINALHPNTAFADLPKEVQTALGESVRTAFQRLQKEGYTVGTGAPPPPPRPRPSGPPSSNEVRRRGPMRPGKAPPRGR